MPAPFVSALELHTKTNIPLFVLQAAIDMGCHCYSSANGAAITRLGAAPSPNIIDLNEYKDRFEEEKSKAIHKAAYVYFKIDELYFYVQREFGEDTALAFWRCLDNPSSSQGVQATPATSALSVGGISSPQPAEAQDRIAGLERQLEEVTRERDEAQKKIEVLTARVAELEAGHEDVPGNANMQIGKLKKRNQEMTAGYEGAAKLACEIGRRGLKGNATPWSEPEVLALAEGLGVTITGDCLKAFKAGMPDDLVKKTPGARPTAPREEDPDVVGS